MRSTLQEGPLADYLKKAVTQTAAKVGRDIVDSFTANGRERKQGRADVKARTRELMADWNRYAGHHGLSAATPSVGDMLSFFVNVYGFDASALMAEMLQARDAAAPAAKTKRPRMPGEGAVNFGTDDANVVDLRGAMPAKPRSTSVPITANGRQAPQGVSPKVTRGEAKPAETKPAETGDTHYFATLMRTIRKDLEQGIADPASLKRARLTTLIRVLHKEAKADRSETERVNRFFAALKKNPDILKAMPEIARIPVIESVGRLTEARPNPLGKLLSRNQVGLLFGRFVRAELNTPTAFAEVTRPRGSTPQYGAPRGGSVPSVGSRAPAPAQGPNVIDTGRVNDVLARLHVTPMEIDKVRRLLRGMPADEALDAIGSKIPEELARKITVAVLTSMKGA